MNLRSTVTFQKVQITDLDNVKKFDFDGYSFVKERSDETTFVFDRPKAETGKKRKTSEDAPPKQEKKDELFHQNSESGEF